MEKSQEELWRELEESIQKNVINKPRLKEGVVMGSLYTSTLQRLVRLPDNMTVEGFIFLGRSGLEELPKNLTVRGNVHARNTPISIPKCMRIEGYLSYNEVFILGKNLLPQKEID